MVSPEPSVTGTFSRIARGAGSMASTAARKWSPAWSGAACAMWFTVPAVPEETG